MNLRGSLRRLAAAVCAVLILSCVPGARAAGEPVHLLLIGVDSGSGQPGGRADAIVLCSFVPETGRMVLTSFLRDLYVPIPGHGCNRLNAAYALGGSRLLEETLEDRLGWELSGSVEVDFERFPRLIDALGGVELELRSDEAAHINRELPGSLLSPGRNRLNGEQTLCFARIRKLDADGDFSRTQRQQAILRALLEERHRAKARELAELAGAILDMVSTDVNPVQLLGWAFRMAPALENLTLSSARIPVKGSFRFRTVRGMSVLEADWELNTAALRRLLEEELQVGP